MKDKNMIKKRLLVILVLTVATLLFSGCTIKIEKVEETNNGGVNMSKDLLYTQAKEVTENAKTENGFVAADEMKKLKAEYKENKEIINENYDKLLAVKCINGTFVGKIEDDNIITYRGIPFVGEQPIGKNRWKAPVDYKTDDKIYEAYYNAKSPCQSVNVTESASLYEQGEDCLYLNVYNNNDGMKNKPVMVWIHGGAFEQGGTIDPLYNLHNLVKDNKDVIAVQLTYRVGVFGCFHLSHLEDGEDYKDAQNLCMLDMEQGLKWVKENIENFGGDSNNITIMGESAGAAGVTLLPLMKNAKKYFNKVICQSGSPVFTRNEEQAIECTSEVLNKLNCKTVADLQKLSPKELVDGYEGLALRVWPERDGRILPIDPYGEYERGACKDITILQGCNKDEVGYFVSAFGGPEGFEPWGVDRKERKLAQLTNEEKELVNEYYSTLEGEEYFKQMQLFDQIVFKAPLMRLLENHTKGGGKTYGYYFRVESSIPYILSGHSVEIPSALNNLEVTQFTGRKFDETFSKTLNKMWVQFARTGNPSLTKEESPDGKEHIWPLYNTNDKGLMIFDEFDIHTDNEENIKLIDWVKTYFITKYFCI